MSDDRGRRLLERAHLRELERNLLDKEVRIGNVERRRAYRPPGARDWEEAILNRPDLVAFYRMSALAGAQPDSGPNRLHLAVLNAGTTPGSYSVPGALSGDADRAFEFNYNRVIPPVGPVTDGEKGTNFAVQSSKLAFGGRAPFTVGALWKQKAGWSYGSAQAPIAGTLVGSTIDGSGSGWSLALNSTVADDVYPVLARNQGSTPTVISGSALTLGTFQLLIGTYDGDTLRLYQNGVLVDSAASTVDIDPSTDVFRVGWNHADPTPYDNDLHYAYGVLDDLIVLAGALTDDEVADLFSFASEPARANGHVIQEEGVTLPQRAKLNFVGANVTATDNPANDRTDVTIVGAGGGGSDWDEEIVKTSDQSVVDSTAYVNDNELKIAIPAGLTLYLVELIVYMTAGSSGTVQSKLRFTFPSNSIGFWSWVAYNLAGSAALNVNTGARLASVANTGDLTTSGSPSMLRAEMLIRSSGSGAAAGDIQLQFANNVAGTGTTTVRIGSILRAKRLI